MEGMRSLYDSDDKEILQTEALSQEDLGSESGRNYACVWFVENTLDQKETGRHCYNRPTTDEKKIRETYCHENSKRLPYTLSLQTAY